MTPQRARQRTLFDPPPIEPSQAAITGELTLGDRQYRWHFHPERIQADWEETQDASGRWKTPGWAFGLLFLDHNEKWRPVRYHGRVWAAWQVVRERDDVRAAIRERIHAGRGH